MPKPPPIDEREFLRITINHSEFCRKLDSLSQPSSRADIAEHACHVGLCWLKLAIEHLEDANSALAAGRRRAAYSRAYYAAYNASKSVRYVVSGFVSLKGDDHSKAADLPDDFTDVEKWAADITKLYEHRLRADYDNWAATQSEFDL